MAVLTKVQRLPKGTKQKIFHQLLEFFNSFGPQDPKDWKVTFFERAPHDFPDSIVYYHMTLEHKCGGVAEYGYIILDTEFNVLQALDYEIKP
jgi:hypothetical protein